MNWFQIVFLREDSQDSGVENRDTSSCELISNCIFTWGFTSSSLVSYHLRLLWIDFKLYFYVRIHKNPSLIVYKILVVNWFQIVFLREDSQVEHLTIYKALGCELISNCIFTWGFTSVYRFQIQRLKLWIDFKLYFYVRIHKQFRKVASLQPVVNWFQIVFLREDSQVSKVDEQWKFGCELISNCIFTWGFTRRTP